ncbi:MAG TPA: rhodanese-like domain-containing protein [Thermoanaerobaculia bacterium]|nr:rhodanese-like domain-containing protein [Thermoanaerobaculia bacterium]
MKSRDLVVFVAAGTIAGGLIVWTATRLGHKNPPTNQATVTNTAIAPAEQSLESIPRIQVPDLNQRIDRGEVVVIDVRAAVDYTAGHIPGAMHIPLAYIQNELPYLPRGKPIVTYCT